jgi:hypothetical protein
MIVVTIFNSVIKTDEVNCIYLVTGHLSVRVLTRIHSTCKLEFRIDIHCKSANFITYILCVLCAFYEFFIV